MRIVWDEPKRLANLVKHGLDFADLDLSFFEGALVRPGHSGRLLALGWLGQDMVVAVVFRPMGRKLSRSSACAPPAMMNGGGSLMAENDVRSGVGYTKADWDDVSDNPEWTADDIANAKPFGEALPELAAAIRKRGPAKTKEAISIRLDIDLVERLRASGAGWQGRVNDAVRQFLDRTS